MPLDLVERIDSAAAASGCDRPEFIRAVLSERLRGDGIADAFLGIEAQRPINPRPVSTPRPWPDPVPPQPIPCPPHPPDRVVGMTCMACGGMVRREESV